MQSSVMIQTPNEALLMQQNNALFQENYARSQNEQQLYMAWKKTEVEKGNAETRVIQLEQVMEQLKLKMSELENRLTQKTPTQKIEYVTDEEELAKETEWIRVKNRKKRKMDTSLTPPQRETKTPQRVIEKTKKPRQPPPIIVEQITDFPVLHGLARNSTNKFNIRVISDTSAKINVENDQDYREITRNLNSKDFRWHSYENKQSRPIRVMVKKLHHTARKESIMADLKNKGYKILDVIPKLRYKTKQPLNMFMLVFSNDENVSKIYEITDILNIKVTVEPMKKLKLVPQCKRCQSYGHTRGYCSREPRCVRCTAKHLTAECDKPRDAKPKCVHCGGEHPANYRGCIVAKEMQKLKNNNENKKSLNKNPPKQPQRERGNTDQKTTQPKNGNRTFSQALAGQHGENQNDSNIEQTLQQILEKLTNLDNRITRIEYSAKGAIPKRLTNGGK